MRDSVQLARGTTRAASTQTFYIIRLLADPGCMDDAYRAYAYFRWLDDWLDVEARVASESQAFVARQWELAARAYAGDPPRKVNREESMLIDLIRGNPDPRGPLADYVNNMMAVMAFDAGRRGRLVSQTELHAYQRALAVSVTEAMHYFIGRGQAAPQSPERYLAVTAAHITHMLRDTLEDLEAGYFNVASEYLRAHGISPQHVHAAPYRQWVRMRVEQARNYFREGRRYLRRVQSLRCRLAAYAYSARFEAVLDLIERDDFHLRAEYGACKSLGAGLRMAGSVLGSSIGMEAAFPAYRTSPPDRYIGRP